MINKYLAQVVHLKEPLNIRIEESHSYPKMFLLPSCIPPLDKSVRGRESPSSEGKGGLTNSRCGQSRPVYAMKLAKNMRGQKGCARLCESSFDF